MFSSLVVLVLAALCVHAAPAETPVRRAGLEPATTTVRRGLQPPTTAATTTIRRGLQAPTTTSVAPASTAAVIGKRGLGFQKTNDTFLFKNANWGYNWWSTYSGQPAPKPGFQYIPMLRDPRAYTVQIWPANAQAAIDAGAPYLLGMNECDILYAGGGQCDLAPAPAAALWKQQMEPFYGKAKLVSPSITNGGGTPQAPLGVLWMNQFLGNCTGCHFDAFAVHIYDSATNIAYYRNYLTQLGNMWGAPLWVTEFGASGTLDQQVSFLQQFQPWLEQQSFIERYDLEGAFAESGNGITMINQADNALTPLGVQYDS